MRGVEPLYSVLRALYVIRGDDCPHAREWCMGGFVDDPATSSTVPSAATLRDLEDSLSAAIWERERLVGGLLGEDGFPVLAEYDPTVAWHPPATTTDAHAYWKGVWEAEERCWSVWQGFCTIARAGA